ncbi:hypothetical protein [Acinetobacter sp.]|uniref:hypothetical protein n=1 Tax=Acinetobacter sp. TaxID=472 RepID=UPI003890C163
MALNQKLTSSNIQEVLNDRISALIEGGFRTKASAFTNNEVILHEVHRPVSEFRTADPPFAQIATNIFDDVKTREINIILRIIKDLERNNPLWYCVDHEKSEVKKGLSALAHKGVISSVVGCKGMYLVNPQQIRNGITLQCYMALLDHVKTAAKKWKPGQKDIKPLPNSKTYINLKALGIGS